MRQRREHQLDLIAEVVRDRQRQVQEGEELVKPLPDRAPARHRDELDLRVEAQKAHQLRAGVAGDVQNADLHGLRIIPARRSDRQSRRERRRVAGAAPQLPGFRSPQRSSREFESVLRNGRGAGTLLPLGAGYPPAGRGSRVGAGALWASRSPASLLSQTAPGSAGPESRATRRHVYTATAAASRMRLERWTGSVSILGMTCSPINRIVSSASSFLMPF